MNILETLERYEPKSLHHEVPIVWESAKDCYVYSGLKAYIDFTSGIFVANVGHARWEVARAMDFCARNRDLIHTYVFPNEYRAKLVKKLCDMTGFEKIFLCTTGSEAVEAALRIMGGADYVAGFQGANHGRTFGAKLVIENGINYGGYPLSSDLGNIDGVIFETYLGYNAQFHPVEWVQAWCNWAKENNIPVCFDEIQAGFGRTGKLFGYEHYGVKPDLICVGKALGGGMPISAVLGSAKLLDAATDLSSTHTGNPVCCAAALATLKIMEDENLVETAARTGDWLEARLKATFPNHKILGKGMIWALDIGDIDLANSIVEGCAKKGLLLVKTHRGTIKIGPPLIIPIEVLAHGLDILREVIGEHKTRSDSL